MPQTSDPLALLQDRQLEKAMACHRAGRLAEAKTIYIQILESSPNHLSALYLLGVIEGQVGQYARVLELTDKAIRVNPDIAEVYCIRGNALNGLRKYHAALESFDKAIRLKPEYAEAYHCRGIALHTLLEYEAALASFDQTIGLHPAYAEAYCNRGIVLYALRQYEAALESCEKAILLKPDFAEAHFNRGNVLHTLEQSHVALESYDQAILLKPDFADAYYNRGITLAALGQYRPALVSFDQTILLHPAHAEAHNNRGSALHSLLQYEAALASFDQAISLRPDFAEAYNNRGSALLALGKYKTALESYEKAAVFRPNYEWLRGMRLHVRRVLCDWENSEGECQKLEDAIVHGEKAAAPFAILAVCGSPAIQMRAAEIYAGDRHPARSRLAERLRQPRKDRLRIGYFSADFYNHATSYLMAELFERHDRSRFEIIGFSFGPDTRDEMNTRVSAAMDRFLDVRTMSDREIAQFSRTLEVDVAVDLKGFTRESRPGIFAERAAPIQVNYLGYPGTMGAKYMDYLIADNTVIPEASRRYYSEKIIYLPDSYQVNDSKRFISTKSCVKADEGLPENVFVYCCFNATYKITPTVFDTWMRILGRVQKSVLWLLEDNPLAAANLRSEASIRGVSPERLIFAKQLPLAEHLARERLADLFLDTFPYGAHTTASDALWAGLPVLTRTGDTFASRVAASLLRAVGFPELVTTTDAEFEQLAVDLARDAKRYQALRQRLEQNRLAAPLFDCQAFTLHLEAAYSAIYERYDAGLPHDHVKVARLLARR